MSEGDTIFRVAHRLRSHLVGLRVLRARAAGGARVERIVGATIEEIETHGKNLLIHFSNGLSVRSHLRMSGVWRLYKPAERWLRPATRAALILEVDGHVAVCFDAPTVELFETRARKLHPVLSRLGPDLLADDFDPVAVVARLRERNGTTETIGEVLLDQHVMAGIGNVYRSEVLFIERVDPFAVVSSLDDETLRRIVATARGLLLRNAGRPGRRVTTDHGRAGSGRPLWVYRRTGQPCPRCGTSIRAGRFGTTYQRTVWWCPGCQVPDRQSRADVERDDRTSTRDSSSKPRKLPTPRQ